MRRHALVAALLLVSAGSACSKKQESERPVDTTLPDDEAPTTTPPTTGAAVNPAEPYDDPDNGNPYGELDSYEGDGEEAEAATVGMLPSPEEPPANRAVSARGNPGYWVTPDDYPHAALREGRRGITGFRVTVGTDGRVIDCQITDSSGSADLDDATCSNVSRRARFAPALQGGQPVESSYSNRVRWILPE